MYKILFGFCLLFSIVANAQKLGVAEYRYLQSVEDSLQYFSNEMVMDTVPGKRFSADSAFIRQFVRALRTQYSFNYRFDSIQTVSKLYPADSSFRIFTWELERDQSFHMQQGVIQMKTNDGSLKIFPLFDSRDPEELLVDSVRSNHNWVGAIYYSMVTKQYQGKKYYTLLGLDDHDFITTRKWIDVLFFDAGGNPHFGGNFFDYKDDTLKPAQPVDRFLYEFKKDASARMQYDPEMDEIIFEHLVSESNEIWKKNTLIPDGDYEGFKWINGRWVHVDKVFTFKLQDGQAPAPKPFYDDSGKPLQNQ